MFDAIRRALSSTRGATAIEYALIAGGVAIVIISAVFAVGDSVVDLFVIDITPEIDTDP
jgi:Flp pilus assembly pilin Flp